MKRSRTLVSASALVCLLQAASCASNVDESTNLTENKSLSGSNAAAQDSTLKNPESDALPEESDLNSPAVVRGFGTITGRRPATNNVVPGIRLKAHDVRVTIRDGFARTEIEEEFANDTDLVLEGRYVFPIPSGASLSKLGLWVEDELVIGEMVEKDRAARIFQGIVDDVVRPRDPALLEWKSGSSFSLKIFPMPARKSRKVLIAYDEVLPIVDGHVKYNYPLSLGPDRAVKMDDFRLHVMIEDAGANAAEAKITGHSASLRTDNGRLYADFSAQGFVPENDFQIDYPRPQSEAVPVAVEGASSDGFFSLRIPVPNVADQSSAVRRHEKIIVLDASHTITETGYASEVAVANEIIRQLDDNDRFAVLLCDSACVAYPERGLVPPTSESRNDVRRFLREHPVSGSSDIAQSLSTAFQRLGEAQHGQVVYLGDGSPSAGELSVGTIAARVLPLLNEKRAELRFIGAGPSIDEIMFTGLAEALSASYERLASGENPARRARSIAASLEKPLLIGGKLELPAGFVDVIPSALPALRAGEEIVVVGKLAGAAGANNDNIRLTGEINGHAVDWKRSLAVSAAPAENRNMLARRWATARIEQLEKRKDEEATKEIVSQSIKHHVMSRHTSLIVLENDRMFAAFGIPRTQGKGQLSSAGQVGNAPSSPDPIGDSFGTGGLGLSGVGFGGGGQGLGDIGTIGHGAGQGFGSGHGRLSGSHRTAPPSVRMGATTVSGRMPPEVIQRIVRQNFGRFRLCYENGLRTNPNLEGRVVVRFVIGRDGNVASVANGGSDMPDSNVTSCVTRAFYGLSFPMPEGGIITVTYPIRFSAGGADGTATSWSGGGSFRPRMWGQNQWIGALDEKWRNESSDALGKLLKSVEESKDSRRARESLINGLLVRGRFDDAFREASDYVTMDPDRAMPHELLARASAAMGKNDRAVAELDTQIDLESSNVDLHKRAARSFEAFGDETRACGHWRSAAELQPNDETAKAESWRCRSRLFGERERVLSEIAQAKNVGKRVVALREALEKSVIPAYEPGRPAGERISVAVKCPDGMEGCPDVVLIDPSGRVITSVTPGSGRSGSSWITLSSAIDGTYRVLVNGGLDTAQGQVEVHLDEQIRKFEVRGGDGARSVATLSVVGF